MYVSSIFDVITVCGKLDNQDMDLVSVETCARDKISGTPQDGEKPVPLLYTVVLMKRGCCPTHVKKDLDPLYAHFFMIKKVTAVIVNPTSIYLYIRDFNCSIIFNRKVQG